MSAAFHLPMVFGSGHGDAAWQIEQREWQGREEDLEEESSEETPPISLAFYRKHTEKLLRRYLYASMQVGRSPAILRDSVGRGWASSRPVRTFEDAVIFVLDVENCIDRLDALDQQLLGRIVLQEYTQLETAAMLGMSPRAVNYKLGMALDRLTELLVAKKVLDIPD